MAGYVIGAGILLFLGWQLWSHRTPPGATEFTGTVIEEMSQRVRRTGSRRLVYAPKVAYRHPVTGDERVLVPTAFGGHRFTVGEQTRLVHDPATDRIFRPLDQPIKTTVVLGLLGIGFIVAEVLG